MLQKFKPACVHYTSTNTYIDYYVVNPKTELLVRKRIKLNSIPKNQLEKYTEKLISEINNKLYNGWNPFIEERKFRKLKDVINHYLELKKKELRPRTYEFYTNCLKPLYSYIEKEKIVFLSDFNEVHANKFIDDLYLIKDWSNIHYNKTLSFY